MKLTRLINIFAVTIVGLTAVLAAAAQNGPNVEISNISGEKRKMCVYNAGDKVGLVPKRCFTMRPGEKVTWNRQGDYQAFQVKIFKAAACRQISIYQESAVRHGPDHNRRWRTFWVQPYPVEAGGDQIHFEGLQPAI